MNLEQWQLLAQRKPQIADALNQYTDEAREDAFYKTLEFGTAGMRGLLGVGPNRMNEYTVGKATYGFGAYLKSLSEHPSVAIAYDNRNQSDVFAKVSAGILSSLGIHVYLFESLRPTPELSYAVRTLGCTGGIVITASHNPKEYNGYKVYDETGCQLVDGKIAKVIALIDMNPDETLIDIDQEDASLIEIIGADMDRQYMNDVLTLQKFPNEPRNIKVAFSSQHGTSFPMVPMLLSEAGYDCIVVAEQAVYDENFSKTLTPNPEDPRSFEKLVAYGERHDADILLTCDPDADRMGIAVKHDGDYVFLTGNQGGSLLLEYLLHHAQKTGMPKDPVVYNTIVTSDLGEKIANHYGVSVVKTLTGFKYIGEQIEKNPQRAFMFGYEESYGYLLADFVRDKDALQACLLVAEAADFYKKQGKTLIDVLQELYLRFGYHREEQLSLSFSGKEGLAEIQAILSKFRAYEGTTFGDLELENVEDYLSQTSKHTDLSHFPIANVLKYTFKDGSWMAVRPSGTEPKCKVYFCIVGDSKESTDAKYEHLLESVKAFIK